MNYKSGICTFCGTGCGHFLRVEDNKIQGVFSSQNHPVSKGRLCVRGWNEHEVLRTEERIKKPLIRKDGSLQEVTYDEAISFMFDRISEKDASENTAFLASPRASNEDNYLFMKLARSVFKCNNISLAMKSGHRAALNVLGKGTGMAGMMGSLEEIRACDFILVVGTDITQQNPIVGSEIHMAAREGARVVTVCSRKTQIARLSKKHLQQAPGSLKILIAAMCKTLVEENLADGDFIAKYTNGIDDFKKSLASVSFSEVEEKTGLKIEEIKQTARELAASEKAMAFFSTGITGLDEETISYVFNLYAMAGKIGKEGCGVNPLACINNLQGGYDMGAAPDLLTGFQKLEDNTVREKFSKKWGTDLKAEPGEHVYKMLSDGNSGIKSLVVVDHDEGIIRFAEQIKALDCVVYIGAFKNKFTELADVVLPVASYVETDGSFTSSERRIQLSGKKTEPFEGVLPAWELFSKMAEMKSVKWGYSSAADVMKEIAEVTPAYSGVTYEGLNKLGGIQWPCNDKHPEGTKRFSLNDMKGKINFSKVSGEFKFQPANEEYPFLIRIGKIHHFWHHNNLMKKTFIPRREYNATLLLYPEGYVEICKEDADKIKVRDNWPVKIVSEVGSMQVAVKISDQVKPGTAYIAYFVQDMITSFLLENRVLFEKGEDSIIPVRIEKV